MKKKPFGPDYLTANQLRFATPVKIRPSWEAPADPLEMIENLTHPEYNLNIDNWEKWRKIYNGGDQFIEEFVETFTNREDPVDFVARKKLTPTPAFAKAAINEIKNSIFQRTTDISRKGGPQSYRDAVLGLKGGVNRKGGTMNWFLGHEVIPELLTMSKVGVFIDRPPIGSSQYSQLNKFPYVYTYCAENIRSWNPDQFGNPRALLLREFQFENHEEYDLPTKSVVRYRYIWLENNKVHVQFYREENTKVGDKITLDLPEIPFAITEISDSLLKDVANHQIALTNAESCDINFIVKANFPFYIEQQDQRKLSKHLKKAQQDYNNTTGEIVCDPIAEDENDIRVGNTQGRIYGLGLDPPGFIHPSPEPLTASMEKQIQLKDDVRKLVHLALSNIQPKMASAESKKVDQHGLEAGLSYIGLELQHLERKIGHIWSLYENNKEEPTIIYPQLWSLKTEEDIRKEVTELEEIRDSIPSKTFQQEVSKQIAIKMVGNKVSMETLEKILTEISNADSVTSDPDVILPARDSGLVSDGTASKLLGFSENEVEKAKADHQERLKRIAESQGLNNPASRGLVDSDPNRNSSSQEKLGKKKRGTNE